MTMNMSDNDFQAGRPKEHPHLTDYLEIVRRRKWVVIAFFIAVVGVVTVKSFKATPEYRGTTQIIIEESLSAPPGIESKKHERMSEEDYQNLYIMLRSRSLARRVADKLNLREYVSSLTKDEKSGVVSRVLSAGKGLAARFAPEKAAARGPKPPLSADMSALKGDDPVVEWYLSRLEVSPALNSRMVKISFTAASPEVSTLVANAHARAFIEKNIETRQSSAQESLDWLKAKLAEQKTAVQRSQQEIYKYNKDNNIVSIENHQSIVAQKLMEFNTSLTRAREARLSKQAAHDQLRKFSVKNADRKKIFSIPAIAQDPLIRTLLGNLSALKAQVAEENYGPKHPVRIQLKEEITRVENELSMEVERLKKNMETDLELAVEYERFIQTSLDSQKRLALDLNEKSIDYGVLVRQAESDQHVYDILLNQFKEMDLARALNSSNIRVIDEAEVPLYPVSPKILVNILASAAGSLFAGIGFAFFMEYADTSMKSARDVAQKLGIPVLDAVPYDRALKAKESSPMPYFNAGVPGLANYSIMSRPVPGLNSMYHGISGNVIVVESATAGEGKTTLLAKFAIDLARGGLRVLVVDADLRNPSLHKVLGFERNGRGVITAMANILSQNVASGDLASYSVADLLFLVSLKKLNGKLTVSNDYRSMSVYFKDGHPCHLHDPDNPVENRLGAMLLRGGFINESQLQDALDRNSRTGEPIGYILVNAGYLARDRIQGPLRLQMEEKLQRIFSWKQGAFAFEPCNMEGYENSRIYFEEDYSPVINRLSDLAGSRYLEKSVLSNVEAVKEPNLSFMPVGIAPAVPYHKAYFTLFEKFIAMLKRRYDIVLIDAPPLMGQRGAVALCTLADGVIMVIKANGAPARVVKDAIADLKKAGVNIIGAIINRAKAANEYPCN